MSSYNRNVWQNVKIEIVIINKIKIKLNIIDKVFLIIYIHIYIYVNECREYLSRENLTLSTDITGLK